MADILMACDKAGRSNNMSCCDLGLRTKKGIDTEFLWSNNGAIKEALWNFAYNCLKLL
jgi:hypothetical protein